MKIFFKGFNFSQDGPGNRLVFHLQGCNMKCPWCSNPEGMPCDGGKEYSTEQIVTEVLRSRPMFFSGGGVSFTGGEATMQSQELTEVLKALKGHGIHTALETNGSSPQLGQIQQYVDYLMMDVKHYDPDQFLKYTGVRLDGVKKNLEYLSGLGRQLHIRIPIINHINSDCPQGFAELFSEFDTKNTVFEFLPYHEYGKDKWKQEYTITDGFISQNQLKQFKTVFQNYGLKVIET